MISRKEEGGHIVVAGENYAQGSSREHAAIAPKYLGQVAVLAKSYARIAWQNLVNFGILPLEFEDNNDYEKFDQGDTIILKNLRDDVVNRNTINVTIRKEDGSEIQVPAKHSCSDRQIQLLLKGGIINEFKERLN